MDIIINVTAFIATFQLRLLKAQEDQGELLLMETDIDLILTDIRNRLAEIGINDQLKECYEEVKILEQYKKELNLVKLYLLDIKENNHRACQ